MHAPLNLNFLRRIKPRIRRRAAPGTRPGTVTIAPDATPTTIRVMAYDQHRVEEYEISDPETQLPPLLQKWAVVWVDVVGLGTENLLRSLAKIFHFHPLALEDVVHVHQRAKVDAYEENLFCVLRIPDPSVDQLTEQFSLFIGKNYVVTFQERPGDDFKLVRDGLRHPQSTTRNAVRPGLPCLPPHRRRHRRLLSYLGKHRRQP